MAIAQRGNPEKGNPDRGKGNPEKSKKPKKHVSGRKALGAKLKQNGRHKVGHPGKAEVEVLVKGGKVASFRAEHPKKGALPVRKIKSKQKMAHGAATGVILASSNNASIQLAQYSDWYYAYWFEEEDDDYFYWFTADDVYVDDTWVEYYW